MQFVIQFWCSLLVGDVTFFCGHVTSHVLLHCGMLILLASLFILG